MAVLSGPVVSGMSVSTDSYSRVLTPCEAMSVSRDQVSLHPGWSRAVWVYGCCPSVRSKSPCSRSPGAPALLRSRVRARLIRLFCKAGQDLGCRKEGTLCGFRRKSKPCSHSVRVLHSQLFSLGNNVCCCLNGVPYWHSGAILSPSRFLRLTVKPSDCPFLPCGPSPGKLS